MSLCICKLSNNFQIQRPTCPKLGIALNCNTVLAPRLHWIFDRRTNKNLANLDKDWLCGALSPIGTQKSNQVDSNSLCDPHILPNVRVVCHFQVLDDVVLVFWSCFEVQLKVIWPTRSIRKSLSDSQSFSGLPSWRGQMMNEGTPGCSVLNSFAYLHRFIM